MHARPTTFKFATTARWSAAAGGTTPGKFEHPFHLSPTANKHDAVEAVELGLAEYERLFGRPLAESCPHAAAAAPWPGIPRDLRDGSSRELISERTVAGLAAARARGRKGGAPTR